MTALKSCFKLAKKVTLYVPATVSVNETVDNTAQVERAAAFLSGCFGGATSTPATGYWVSDSQGLVKEGTTLVFAYATEDALETHMGRVVEYCRDLCAEMKQEAVALEYDGSMYLIAAETLAAA